MADGACGHQLLKAVAMDHHMILVQPPSDIFMSVTYRTTIEQLRRV